MQAEYIMGLGQQIIDVEKTQFLIFFEISYVPKSDLNMKEYKNKHREDQLAWVPLRQQQAS